MPEMEDKIEEKTQSTPQNSSSMTELQSLKNVNNGLIQDALNVWSELWAELDGQAVPVSKSSFETESGFKPSCGWPQYLEKMWVLRYYLDFAKRINQQ
jgi:hypothetical protein